MAETKKETVETVEKEKSWYIRLKTTPIYFQSLTEARKWCKNNYLLGVFHGWTKG